MPESALKAIVKFPLANLMGLSGTLLGHSRMASLTCPRSAACLVDLHTDPALLYLIVNECLCPRYDFLVLCQDTATLTALVAYVF